MKESVQLRNINIFYLSQVALGVFVIMETIESF